MLVKERLPGASEVPHVPHTFSFWLHCFSVTCLPAACSSLKIQPWFSPPLPFLWAMQLSLWGSQFPNQGLNPGHGSESPESLPLGHQGNPDPPPLWSPPCPSCPPADCASLGDTVTPCASFYYDLSHYFTVVKLDVFPTKQWAPSRPSRLKTSSCQLNEWRNTWRVQPTLHNVDSL